MADQQYVKHGLGLGFGSLYVYPDGTVEYTKGLSTVFKVRSQEVTGFSVTRGTKWHNRRLHILGHGTTLAIIEDLGVDTCERIEQIFRSHPLFSQEAPGRRNSQDLWIGIPLVLL